jgi:hypothetical protein
MSEPCAKDSSLYKSPSEHGLTNGEWVKIGEEVGQWQMGEQGASSKEVSR